MLEHIAMRTASASTTMQLSAEFADGVAADGSFVQTDFVHGPLPNSLCFAAAPKYVEAANRNRAISCLITREDFASSVRDGLGIVVSPAPERSFYTLHNRLYREGRMRVRLEAGIDASAEIHPMALVEPGCRVEAGVRIGENAIVKAGTVLEKGVFVGPGAMIGVEGNFYRRFDSHLLRIEHAGGVKVGSNAQILAGAIIQRALFTNFTEIGAETVLAPGVHIGHGVRIGSRTTIAGCSHVGGFTRIGDEVWIGPGCAVSNLIEIGDHARIELGSVVGRSVAAGQRFSGFYAGPHLRMLRGRARFLSE